MIRLLRNAFGTRAVDAQAPKLGAGRDTASSFPRSAHHFHARDTWRVQLVWTPLARYLDCLALTF